MAKVRVTDDAVIEDARSRSIIPECESMWKDGEVS